MAQFQAAAQVRFRSLGDIVVFLDHKRRPVRESDRTPGPYPYFGANGQQGTIDDFLFDEPLVLLAEDGGHFEEPSRGIAYRVSGKVWVNNHAHVLRPKQEIDWAYLTRVLENLDVRRYVSGTTRGKLTKAQAEDILLPVPSLPEQRRIAAILDQADALRAKRRAALAQLEGLEQAMFAAEFGDADNNIRDIPTARLADICHRVTDGTHQSPTWDQDGLPFLFVSDIITGDINFDTSKRISNQTHAELTRLCPVEVGDVLYSTVGSYGVPVLVRDARKFAFQRHIAHIKPDKASVDSEFLRIALATPSSKRQADRAARGMAQKTINLGFVRS